MMVANAAVALRPSRRASRYGRMTSPARAGNRNVAAKPITVVLNAVPKVGRANRRQQVLPPQGANGVGHTGYGDRQQQRPRVGAAGFTPDVGDVHAAKENAQQPEGQQEDEGVPNSWLHAPV